MDTQDNKVKFYKKEWFKFLLILSISILIAIIGVKNNIEYERDRIYKELRSKIKVEVEKDLYKELIEKYKDSIRRDLKKEYRDFVRVELESSLKEDTMRTLKHEIQVKSGELSYEMFESMDYKSNGEDTKHVKVIVENLDNVFQEELEGLFRQVFGVNSEKRGVLLVFPKSPEECDFIPSYRVEGGYNEEIIVMSEDGSSNFSNLSIIS